MEREEVLARYRMVLQSCARSAQHDSEALRAAVERLKLYAVIHRISAVEHDEAVRVVGIDPAVLRDRQGNAVGDMLRAREVLSDKPAGAFVTPLPERPPAWRTRPVRSLPSWQSAAGIIAIVLLIAGLMIVLL